MHQGSIRFATAVVATVAFAAFSAPAAEAASLTVSAGTLAFGSFDPLSQTPTDGTSTVTVTSAAAPGPIIPASYTIMMSRGVAPSFSPRQMRSGSNILSYNIYTDAARTTVWGDGTAGTTSVSGQVNSGGFQQSTTAHTVYGRVPGGQNRPAGTYSDTITVTVTF